jgi:hypothetical protein
VEEKPVGSDNGLSEAMVGEVAPVAEQFVLPGMARQIFMVVLVWKDTESVAIAVRPLPETCGV